MRFWRLSDSNCYHEIFDRFESWDNALEQAGVGRDNTELFKIWEKKLQGLNGWYNYSEIVSMLNDLTEYNFSQENYGQRFLEFVNRRDKVSVRHKTTSRGVIWYIETKNQSLVDRYNHLTKEMTQKEIMVFKEMISIGKKPSTIAAAIHYVTSSDSQKEAADKFSVGVGSVRNNHESVEIALSEKSDLNKNSTQNNTTR